MTSSPSIALRSNNQLARLDATVTRAFGQSVDLDLAGIADPQGIGGNTGHPLQRSTRAS